MIEQMRQQLLKNPEFDLNHAFHEELDVEDKKYITSNDIAQYLSRNGINISKQTQELLLNRYNRRADKDKVSYSEFIEDITPKATNLN